MIRHMGIAIDFSEFNDLGRSVTPNLLFTVHFFLPIFCYKKGMELPIEQLPMVHANCFCASLWRRNK